MATSLRCKCNTRNVTTITKSLLLCIHFSASAPNHYIHPDTLQERELGQRHCSLSPGDISQTQQGKADINGYGYIHYWPKTLHKNNHLYMYNTCPTIADPGISDILNCSWISIPNSYPNTDMESSAAQLFPSPCQGSFFPSLHREIHLVHIKYAHIETCKLMYKFFFFISIPRKSRFSIPWITFRD